MTKYRIETWNPITNKYEVSWEGPEQYAKIMMNKSYNARHTRRLIKTTVEVLIKAKAGQYISHDFALNGGN